MGTQKQAITLFPDENADVAQGKSSAHYMHVTHVRSVLSNCLTMLCPICHSEDIGTARTIQESWGVKRLRKCRRCCHEWATAELPAADIAGVAKSPG
jgi:Zn-finger protein